MDAENDVRQQGMHNATDNAHVHDHDVNNSIIINNNNSSSSSGGSGGMAANHDDEGDMRDDDNDDDDDDDAYDEIDDEDLTEDERIEKYWGSGKIASQMLDDYLPMQQLNTVEQRIVSLLDIGAELMRQLSQGSEEGKTSAAAVPPDGSNSDIDNGSSSGSGIDSIGGDHAMTVGAMSQQQQQQQQQQVSLVESYVSTVRSIRDELGSSIRSAARFPRASYQTTVYTERMRCQLDREKQRLLQELKAEDRSSL